MYKIIKSPLIIWLGGIFLFFIILSLGRKNPVFNKFPKMEVYEAKLQLALMYMQQDGKPMEGIILLKNLTNAYPNRFEAPMHLGEFCMNTGQYAKASNWFKKAESASVANDKKIAAFLNWSDALIMQNKKDSAKIILMKVTTLTNDSLILQPVLKRVNELK